MCRFGYAKGAYQESSDVAYVAKVNVDANFAKLMEALLCEGTSPAITSHDEQILNHLLILVVGYINLILLDVQVGNHLTPN